MKNLFFLFLLLVQVTAHSKELLCPAGVADPALVNHDGKVLVMGTGNTLQWNSVHELVDQKKPETYPTKLFQEVSVNGITTVVPLNPDELPWDLQFYQISGKRYLYGGVMTPRRNLLHAVWPQDNISRRIKVATFRSDLNGWVFKLAPVFGSPSHNDWKGHSYGQQIVTSKGKTYMLHEEITESGVTEIFIRRLLNPFKASSRGKKIIGINDLSKLASRRLDGGHLLEGPRYQQLKFKNKLVHAIYFSTGDFPTNNYATRLAYSDQGILGPYKVLEDDLTKTYAQKNNLYGVGRAFPFQFEDKQWIIFHGAKTLSGVDHSLWPGTLDNFQRCLFASPVQYSWQNNKLQVSLDDNLM